jgi:hypothetical protein
VWQLVFFLQKMHPLNAPDKRRLAPYGSFHLPYGAHCSAQETCLTFLAVSVFWGISFHDSVHGGG